MDNNVDRLIEVTPAMKKAWVEYDPPERFAAEIVTPFQCAAVRHAFMAGYHEAATTLRHQAGEIDALKSKLRCIIAHATGGGSDNIDRGLNDICVEISRHHNSVFAAGEERARTALSDNSQKEGV